jgi:two-component system OmpR family sensor kinase
MDWNRPMRLLRKTRPTIWNVPVGLQLSVIYAILLAATLTLLGWALYLQLDGFLVKNTAEHLQQTANNSIQQRFDGFRLPGGPDDAFGRPHRISPQQLVAELSGPDVVVAVLDANGTAMASTLPRSDGTVRIVPGLPDDWTGLVSTDHPAQWVTRNEQASRQLVLLSLIGKDSSTGSPVYLEQAASLAAADDLLNQVRLYVALGIIVGTVIGVVVGLWLTRIVLRPLDRMAGTAEAIAGGDLDRRLRLPPGRNEVARLGSAFDHMVGRLAASLETQRRFVADASHELRTPLTSLEGLSEMLLMGADQGDAGTVQRTVRSMHGELARMGRLVSDLLTLSRLDGRAPMQRASVDVSRVLGEVAGQMAPLAEAKGAHISMRSDGPVYVQGDADKLRQVLINLVDNAVRYTPADGHVFLSALADSSARRAQIQVQDTGPGIPAKDVPHIFDRFYRGDLSRTRSTGNSGLGLAIGKAIAEAHGGTITARSNPGEGACFIVTLPLDVSPPLPSRPQVAEQKKDEEAVPARS